jgi:hypothetical protein
VAFVLRLALSFAPLRLCGFRPAKDPLRLSAVSKKVGGFANLCVFAFPFALLKFLCGSLRSLRFQKSGGLCEPLRLCVSIRPAQNLCGSLRPLRFPTGSNWGNVDKDHAPIFLKYPLSWVDWRKLKFSKKYHGTLQDD